MSIFVLKSIKVNRQSLDDKTHFKLFPVHFIEHTHTYTYTITQRLWLVYQTQNTVHAQFCIDGVDMFDMFLTLLPLAKILT